MKQNCIINAENRSLRFVSVSLSVHPMWHNSLISWQIYIRLFSCVLFTDWLQVSMMRERAILWCFSLKVFILHIWQYKCSVCGQKMTYYLMAQCARVPWVGSTLFISIHHEFKLWNHRVEPNSAVKLSC